MSAKSRSSSRTSRSARPPYGHSTSLLLDHGHRRVERTADVIRLGIDREFEVEERLRAAEQASMRRRRQPSDDAEHQPRDGSRAPGAGEDAGLGVLELCVVEGAPSSETVKPTTALAPAAATRPNGLPPT